MLNSKMHYVSYFSDDNWLFMHSHSYKPSLLTASHTLKRNVIRVQKVIPFFLAKQKAEPPPEKSPIIALFPLKLQKEKTSETSCLLTWKKLSTHSWEPKQIFAAYYYYCSRLRVTLVTKYSATMAYMTDNNPQKIHIKSSCNFIEGWSIDTLPNGIVSYCYRNWMSLALKITLLR